MTYLSFGENHEKGFAELADKKPSRVLTPFGAFQF